MFVSGKIDYIVPADAEQKINKLRSNVNTILVKNVEVFNEFK